MDTANQDVVKRLCAEMKTLNPTVPVIQVRGKFLAVWFIQMATDCVCMKGWD